jgi:hydrogenase maturation protease
MLVVSPQTLLLFLGNPIVENDQLGLVAGRRIALRLSGRPGVEAREFTGSPLDLLAECTGSRLLLMIDTVCTGRGEPGTVFILDEEALLGCRGDFYPHGMNLPQAFALARRLRIPLPDRIYLIGIEVSRLHRFGENPAPEIAGRLEEICLQVESAVEELLSLRSIVP